MGVVTIRSVRKGLEYRLKGRIGQKTGVSSRKQEAAGATAGNRRRQEQQQETGTGGRSRSRKQESVVSYHLTVINYQLERSTNWRPPTLCRWWFNFDLRLAVTEPAAREARRGTGSRTGRL